jgi:integrase
MSITVSVNSFGSDRNLMLVYRDPLTGRKVARSAGTRDEREAERRAAVWQDELNAGRYLAPSRVTWTDFRKQYREQKLITLSKGGATAAETALNHLERVMAPDRLARVTTAFMGAFQAKLREGGAREVTIGKHLRHIRAATNWAVSAGLLAAAPKIVMPRRLGSKMKGRPITAEEFDRMLAAVPAVRPRDAAAWAFLLRGLWLSGLRISEAVALSWEPSAAFCADLDRRRPAFIIRAEGQKSGKDEVCPMVPEFARLLEVVPRDCREGRVFRVDMTSRDASRVVAEIGRKAGVVVDPATGRCAGAHDLRRSFCTKWASKVMPAVLQRLARHAHISTTLGFYVSLDSDAIADELWADDGNTRGNSGPTKAPRRRTRNRR